MAIIQGNTKVSAGGYTIDNAIKFNGSATAQYLNRSQLAGEQKKFSVSFWMKRAGGAMTAASEISALLVAAGVNNWDSASMTYFPYLGSNTFHFYSSTTYKTTSQVFRDPGAWMHVLCAFDSTLATAADRFRMYINGIEVTAFSTNNNPALNMVTFFNNASYSISVGGSGSGNGNQWFDGYMAELIIVDGQQLTPSDVGEFSSQTGAWVPIKFTGSVGTNGGIYKFDNASNLGEDSSANGLDFTVYGSPVQVTDTPTENFCTLNPLDAYSATMSPKDGNLAIVNSSGGSYQAIRSTLPMTSGKWYVEGYIAASGSLAASRTGPALYTASDLLNTYGGVSATSWAYWSGGYAVNNSVLTALTSGSLALNDIFQIAFDADAGKLWFGKNGTWLSSGDPSTGANPIYSGLAQDTYFIGGWAYNTSDRTVLNFGQTGGFTYTPPTGFLPLSTSSLPEPTIKDGSAYFSPAIYSGTRSATEGSVGDYNDIDLGLSFTPSLSWLKARNEGTFSHLVLDEVRGDNKVLLPNSTAAEYTADPAVGTPLTSGFLSQFNSGGIRVYRGSGSATPWRNVNESGYNYVTWNWLAGNGTSQNADGSITSTVSANTAGFSVVTWTGNDLSGQTIGHGLGLSPKITIIKKRSSALDWQINLDSSVTGTAGYFNFNSAALYTAYPNYYTSMNSSVLTSNGTNSTERQYNNQSATYVAYCFAEVDGFSKFGKYTGNGSTDGPFVWCGFRPAFVMLKRTDSTGDWYMDDAARDPYNVVSKHLEANLTAAEFSTGTRLLDFVSNGFKHRRNDADTNASGGTYIFMAFAETPFKYANAR